MRTHPLLMRTHLELMRTHLPQMRTHQMKFCPFLGPTAVSLVCLFPKRAFAVLFLYKGFFFITLAAT